MSDLGIASVVRQSITFGLAAAKASKLGDAKELAYVEKQFEEFLKFFPDVMYSTQMPEYRYQAAVEAYTAAFLKETSTTLFRSGRWDN